MIICWQQHKDLLSISPCVYGGLRLYALLIPFKKFLRSALRAQELRCPLRGWLNISMTAHLLWPTYMWEETEDPTLALALAQELLPDDFVLRDWTDVRPWASDDLLHHRAEWESIKDRILETAVRFADHQGILYSNLYITSMWVNAQYQRQNHVAHTHPNSLFSGVWYLDTPPGSQCFMLFDPRPASSVIKPRTRTQQGNIGVAARAGSMLMWPSWLQHSTQSITVDELDRPRIALAFNIMLRDTIDDHSARIDFL